ncbi:MAG: DUF4350 domain-containing protein [Kofleriaceae bacterium]
MTNPFSRTTLWIIVGVGLASLAVTVVLTVMGPGEKYSIGSDGYSVSAIGHKALVEMLEKLDVPVVLSRNDSSTKAKNGLLVIAEPKIYDKEADRLKALIDSGPKNVLLVLPKWWGYADTEGRWVGNVELQPLADVDEVLKAVGVTNDDPVSRTPASTLWKTTEGFPLPKIKIEAQGIQNELVEPVIHDGARSVLARLESSGAHTIWVLADPDIINNAGLRQKENAQLAIALIDKLRDGGPVVFDETIHGHQQTPSLLHVLFEFPLVIATMQVLICALLVLWAAMVRFGPKRAPPPPLAPGKDFLIKNTAALLRFGGHDAEALQRYLAANVVIVKQQLHAPDSLGPSALVQWLERIRVQRAGKAIPLPALQEAVAMTRDPQRVLEVADQVYRWRMEMIHGSKHRT